MTNEVKEQKTTFLFQTLDTFLNEKINLIAGELKEDSTLDKESIAKLLLEVFNRSSIHTKILFPCPMCHNLQTDCIACDLLIQETQSYK